MQYAISKPTPGPADAEQVNALPWFHQIDFGNGLLSPGVIRADKIRRMAAMIYDRPLAGKSGARYRMLGRSLQHRGDPAGRRAGARDRSFRLARWLGRQAVLRPGARHLAPSMRSWISTSRSSRRGRVGTFDMVLFLGVFYHLRHPFRSAGAGCVARREVLVVESRIVAPLSRRPFMRFYPGSSLDGDPTNWWAPNRACMEAILRDLRFRRIRFRRPDWRLRRGLFHAER